LEGLCRHPGLEAERNQGPRAAR